MKDIFSELYKKVLSFFNNEVKEENSKDTACNRLKLVLMQDRAKMEPALMEKMREEMIEVISKYVEIDKEALDLNLEAEGESFALMLNIPVLRAKTREEVEAAEGILAEDDDDDIDDIDDIDEDDIEEESETSDEDTKDDEDETSDNVSVEDAEESDVDIQTEDNSDVGLSNKEDDVDISDERKEESLPNPAVIKPSPVKKKYKHEKDDDL